ncbi:MAG: 50S ribosomal protein L6 [Candidatus Andersenbacteria bacterium]|nr:50S ribosomal protein L6 [Candidatus Andersenbacteria bacterium]
MSRIGKQPIPLPTGVTFTVNGRDVAVKGPKGELSHRLHHTMTVSQEGTALVCTVAKTSKESSALWGTTRALIAAMVSGVTAGFTKKLEMQGVGYRAALKGKNLELSVGFSHTVPIVAPEGISFKVEKELITVEGANKYLVGQVAANIRAVRPPEPYKGKGIRYQGEKVRRKVGKVVGTTA